MFRIARIMRIFKLARRSVGLQSIAHTVRTSWKDLGLLFSLVAMGMLVFGSLEYFIENDQVDTGFTSIPQVLLRIDSKQTENLKSRKIKRHWWCESCCKEK